ncbi:MAG: Sir2 family NAD-dependent protein deacetylase [Nocardioides sp.]
MTLLERETVADGLDAVLAFLRDRPLVVLTGAGVSTDSGIPDYRGPGSVPRSPMSYQQFVSGPEARQRYWARVHVGFGRFSEAAPNDGHRALARLDPTLLITQNVDGLHEAAGSRRLVALHGRISDVICLSCRGTSSRRALEERLTAANPGWAEAHADLALRPDGDVEVRATDGFVVPDCERCGGVLKPDVVLFGENVPAERVVRCYDAVDALGATGALVAVGSSLTVMSGLRFVKRAARAGTPVVIANRGATRGDDLATYCLEVGCSEFLTALEAS